MTLASQLSIDFGIGPRGYLPDHDPLERLPAPFDAWEEVARSLPKFLATDHVRERIESLPDFELGLVVGEDKLRRAMVLLSFLAHAYVWGGERPAGVLPAKIAVPWHAVAKQLGRPPVLSYASYALDNWRRLDYRRDVELGNIVLIQNFLGGIDEEWFILIHIDIERRAAMAIQSLLPAMEAARDGNERALNGHLASIEGSLAGIYATMDRMPEHCDPYVYYHRVRPFIHGWKNHPDLPDGLIYEGVSEYQGMPQQFRGETGAQSSIVPALDAAFGVHHEDDALKSYLMEMRTYMPPQHRQYIEHLEGLAPITPQLDKFGQETHQLHNACIDWMEQFRTLHLRFAAKYIFEQAQTDPKNPSKVGTGGTPFMKYLKKHRDETAAHGTEPMTTSG